MVSNAYQEYLLQKDPTALLEPVDQHRVNALASAVLVLGGGDRTWLGGSSSLIPTPCHQGEAPFPSRNAWPAAATALLNSTGRHVVPEGSTAAPTALHKFQLRTEDSSLMGF